ncbi:MAG TPA: NADH:flavin oxidoreductase/NADH oxidase [Acidimicrobiales bacterium]|nr:NADH:flavin oxidoreductase/NADH oxidase [Acidimicrobiales bacterium]
MSILFSPLTLRGTTFRNRVWVSPMCQYSSTEGHPTDWHLVHLGAFARGGSGLVMTEATAVSPEGRISPWDAGLWSDQQAEDYERIVRFVQQQGAAAGVQLGHAGRKGSTARPWERRGAVPLAGGGWVTVAPSPIAYGGWPPPEELTAAGIGAVVGDFRRAAARADAAGFDVVEIHAAHGYLLHQFLSPLTNRRSDAYGGDLEGRSRLLREVVAAVRSSWPERKPLLVRLSATDWADGGWTPEETVAVARELAGAGVDLVDVSSGGNVPEQRVVAGPGYQVPFAAAVRREAGVATAAVGLIVDAEQAEQVLAGGSADAVFLARALLRDPHWPLAAAQRLGHEAPWPAPYERARPTAAR